MSSKTNGTHGLMVVRRLWPISFMVPWKWGGPNQPLSYGNTAWQCLHKSGQGSMTWNLKESQGVLVQNVEFIYYQLQMMSYDTGMVHGNNLAKHHFCQSQKTTRLLTAWALTTLLSKFHSVLIQVESVGEHKKFNIQRKEKQFITTSEATYMLLKLVLVGI